MWKEALRIVIDRQNLTAKFCEPTRNQSGTSAVTTIYCYLQPRRFDRLDIECLFQDFNVMIDRILILDRRLNPVPTDFGKFSLVKDIQQLFCLGGVQVKAIATHELQRIPLAGIVSGSDRNSAVSLEPQNRQLQARRRTHPKVYHFAARR